MSYWIYHTQKGQANRLAALKLTGTGGLLAEYLKGFGKEQTPFVWRLSANDLLERAGFSPLCHLIALDMMPESFTKVCLYRLVQIQGSSDLDESDLVVAFKVLLESPAQRFADAMRQSFALHEQEPGNRQILEALRLTGGTRKGNYFWARPKMDIGAAVCPSTQTYQNSSL